MLAQVSHFLHLRKFSQHHIIRKLILLTEHSSNIITIFVLVKLDYQYATLRTVAVSDITFKSFHVSLEGIHPPKINWAT